MRKVFVVLVSFLLLIPVIWVGIVTVKVAFPHQGANLHSDAVISLAPHQYRLPIAFKIFEAGSADNHAISWFPENSDPAISVDETLEYQLCAESTDPHIICFTPNPSTTLGEALAIRQMATEHNWKSATVVTSEYHAFRTGFIFEHCLGPSVEINVIHSNSELGLRAWLFHISYENAAFIKAIFETQAHCN